MRKFLITGLTVHTEKKSVPNAAVYIEHDKIRDVSTAEAAAHINDCEVIALSETDHLVPGFIDMHIHGFKGVDVMDGTREAIDTLCRALPATGTTAFLPTTMTQSKTAIEQALKNIATYATVSPHIGAEILGIHLEGPFISENRLGAHKKCYVLAPDMDLFNHWQTISSDTIKMVTVAPEVEGALEFIYHLRQHGVIASIGHTDATLSQTRAGITAGCTHATHLYNAMSGFHHRHPGAVPAILSDPNVLAELIVDGLHVSPEVVTLSLLLKGANALCLVTDSMRATCMGEGAFELGGQTITVQSNEARCKNGALAGSVLTMQSAVQNMLQYSKCDMHTILKLTAENPAKQLGLFKQKGSIAVGKDADLVVLDKDYRVKMTFCRGDKAFERDH